MSVRPPILPRGTTPLPLDFLLRKLTFEYFSKMLEKKQVSLKPDKNIGYCTWTTMHMYDNNRIIISRWILLRMRNVSDKCCRAKQNTFCVCVFFPENRVVTRKFGKVLCIPKCHRWQYNTSRVHCVLDTYGYRHTPKICNTYYNSAATMVRRTPLFNLYAHCQSC